MKVGLIKTCQNLPLNVHVSNVNKRGKIFALNEGFLVVKGVVLIKKTWAMSVIMND